MIFRTRLLASAMLLAIGGLVPHQVHAGLFGAASLVPAFYFDSTVLNPEGENQVGGSTTDPTSATVDYQQGGADGTLIHTGDPQITITNLLPGAPFCFENMPGDCLRQPD